MKFSEYFHKNNSDFFQIKFVNVYHIILEEEVD